MGAVNDFEASKLGTKEYWDSVYDRENKNFKEIGDIGEVWFGEESVERMVDWITENIPQPETSIVDLGCGNGHLLLELSAEGYNNLTGIDYSEQAIELARAVAHDRGLDSIRYEAVDLLSVAENAWTSDENNRFQLVLDKGTFDAISLHPDQEAAKESGRDGPREQYVQAVSKIMQSDGIFLITSCNWTMDELISIFQKPVFPIDFKYHSHVKYPTFSFGGQTGSKICTVAFAPLP
ncbi:S-adenosyl-L-methionine-dependent methyltransferase [Dichotomocladium elegans]|nr:S-adenosyl-L-methionine-dependent methyltransferase [Dichotomocladium elegans]